MEQQPAAPWLPRMTLYAPSPTSRSPSIRRSILFLTCQEAQAALEAVLADEPGWAGRIGVVELELETAKNDPQAFGSPGARPLSSRSAPRTA